jgi:hypothetical protein
VFEWFAARLDGRERCDLYHSALQVYIPEARFVIEQAPVWREDEERGVVGEGAVAQQRWRASRSSATRSDAGAKG